jgi:hypothetical protein
MNCLPKLRAADAQRGGTRGVAIGDVGGESREVLREGYFRPEPVS